MEEFPNRARSGRQWRVTPLKAESHEHPPIRATRPYRVQWSGQRIRILAQQRGIVLEQPLDLQRRKRGARREQLALGRLWARVHDRFGLRFQRQSAPIGALSAASLAGVS